MNNFANGSFHSDDAFCALLPQVKAQMSGTDVRGSPQTWCLHMVTSDGKLNCPQGKISCQLFVARL